MEPLLAWADMMSVKALEVSENFLMSTGLGTLRGENRESQNSRGASESRQCSLGPGLKEKAGQWEAVLACELSKLATVRTRTHPS